MNEFLPVIFGSNELIHGVEEYNEYIVAFSMPDSRTACCSHDQQNKGNKTPNV